MTDTDRELGLHDEDRLPWLEAVETDEEDEGVAWSKIIGFGLAALALLALVVFAVGWLGKQQQGPDGDGTLIAAQEGDYKVKPDSPGGMKVEGQGDSAFKASEGAEPNGKIDQSATPEAPVAGVKQAAAVPKISEVKPGKPTITTSLAASSGKLVAPVAPVAGSGSGGALVQFGAYGSEAGANTAWAALVARNPTLGKLAKSIAPAAVGGKTLYRLRANAGTAASAAAICGQVGNCIVVK
jgi:SPOR domain